MKEPESEAKCFKAGLVKKPAKRKSQQRNPVHKPPPYHRNVPAHIKDMWEVYLGFTKLEF